MPELEPITREEMLLDGQDLEPITRKEMFIKRIYDKTQVIPEPITREEMFLKKAGDETTDVTIEQLNVSENGTYSEEGVAYSPVIVNVPAPPIPDNAYLLNEVEGLPKDIATFTDGSNLPMPHLKVGIEPIQEGSGDPSPENVRPISGWSAVDVNKSGVNVWDEEWELGTINDTTGQTSPSNNNIRTKNYISVIPNTTYYKYIGNDKSGAIFYYDKDENFILRDSSGNSGSRPFTTPNNCYFVKLVLYSSYGTTYNNDISINYPSTDTSYHAYNPNSETITIQLGDTYYGGKLDVVSGVMTVDKGYVDLGTLNWSMSLSTAHAFYARPSLNYAFGEDVVILCSKYPFAGTRTIGYYAEKKLTCYRRLEETMPSEFYIQDNAYSDATTFKTAMNGVQLVYELATPTTIQLTPTQVNSLLGVNNISANSGKIINGQYFSKGGIS